MTELRLNKGNNMTFYDDLMTSLTEVKEHLEGKRTLPIETLKRPKPLYMSADEVKAIKTRLNLSQTTLLLRLIGQLH